jgi:hypothetical protein
LWQNSFFEGKDRYFGTELYDINKEAATRAYDDQAILKQTNPSPNSTFHHKTTNEIQIRNIDGKEEWPEICRESEL